MRVEIEQAVKIVNSFRKKEAKSDDDKWHTASQKAFWHEDGSKYPTPYELSLEFSDVEQDVIDAKALPAGMYELREDAFYIDNRSHMQINAEKLQLIKS